MTTDQQDKSQNLCDRPVFIIGTERSGSNLLRLILNAHPKMTVPHPPHIMSYFAPVEKLYGDLAVDENFRHMAQDVVAHVHGHIHPWPSPIDLDRLCNEAYPRDLFGLYAGVYDQHLAATGKEIWGCKSTFMIHYVDRILARYPGARLIWLVRDPRDVAVSSRDSVFNPFHPYLTAELWAKQQQLALDLEQRLRPNTLYRLTYEALVQQPEATVQALTTFLGIDFVPGMLRFFETEDAKTSASLARDWRNTAAPILSNNANKFVTKLTRAEIHAVERAAAPVMQKLGYALLTDVSRPEIVSGIERFWFNLRNELARMRVEYHSLLEDRNQWRRWARSVRVQVLAAQLKLGLR